MYYEPCFHQQTTLWLAIKFKRSDVVRTLIILGQANISHMTNEPELEMRITLLSLVCITGHLEIGKCFVENGVD